MKKGKRCQRQAGVALVLVLWITVLLTIMAGAFTLTLQREAKLVGNLKARSEANALAEAGLYYAMLMLSINDSARVWKANRSIHEWPFYNGVVNIQIGDERGKIDLNLAERNLLLKMFASIGVDAETADKLVDAIFDWRDQNDEVHANGAEQKDYKQQNLPYGPRNGPFQSIEELQFVLGMTPQLYKAVEPMLTVYSHNAAVNKTKATAAVLKVLEMDMEDDMSGKNTSPGSQAGAAETAAEDGESGGENAAEDAADADSENSGGENSGGAAAEAGGAYSIDAAATLPDGYTGRIRIVARREGPLGFTILNWKYVTAASDSAGDYVTADTPNSIDFR